MVASWLATMLDQESLAARGVFIADRATRDEDLEARSGADVARELSGRMLLRYLLDEQVDLFKDGSIGHKHWVTPTPYAPPETIKWLCLPRPNLPRQYVMLIDPAKVNAIKGPRWIRGGLGIEYFLPDGFPQQALMSPSVLQVS
jgi:hypothetical protein